jgi:DNA repair protein RecN (Recombination protein N)
MLQRLFIQNYALIRALDLKLENGFTAITGETGSGKSILLGALGLTLGERADTHVLFEKDVKCIVEAEFDLTNHNLKSFFDSNDLDYLALTTLRREISPSGRSRAFVNDSPVQLTILREIAQQLVDLHSQHQTLLLRDEDFQLSLLDLFAEHGAVLSAYQSVFFKRKAKQEELRKLKSHIKEHQIDKDYLQFQLDEIDSVKLEIGEDERVTEELGLLEHAKEIKSVLHAATSNLDSENGLLDQLNTLSHQLDSISVHSKGLQELSQRVDSVRLELDDVRSSIEDVDSKVEIDPERQEILEDAVNAFQKLFNKHRVNDVSELIALRDEIDEKLVRSKSTQQELASISEELILLETELDAKSQLLTKARNKAKTLFIDAVTSQFEELSMPNAKIEISVSQSSDYHLLGIDDVNILFNANKGGRLEILSNVASGGELSRLMLILKGELASARQLPTLIFDEIDTGVSGEIASQMAGKLRNLSEGRQVISITHLPQVAARAHQHYRITKSDTDERSITDVEVLDHDGRILEMAKMLSGTRVSSASVENARDLLSN